MHFARRPITPTPDHPITLVYAEAMGMDVAHSPEGLKPFLLVHGAWHGGWCWKKTASLLRVAGHEVFTPSLTGLGERAHQLAPEIDLTTHINDVLGVLEYEDLRNVVLVGHSYGGMVISGVAARAPARLAHLVYLDAFLPETGEALTDYGMGAIFAEIATTKGDGWRVPSALTARGFGITDEQDAAWVDARIGAQPYKTFTQPIALDNAGDDRIHRAYILATQGLFEAHSARARAKGFDCYELVGAGHNVMVTRPTELAALLLQISESRTTPPA